MPEEPLKEATVPEGEASKGEIGSFPSVETGPTPKVEAEPHQEMKEGKYNELLSQLQASTKSAPLLSESEVALDTKTVAEAGDEETKLRHLLDLAHTKGPVHAVRVAQSLQDYYTLDRMHDELSEAFFEKLSEKGLV